MILIENHIALRIVFCIGYAVAACNGKYLMKPWYDCIFKFKVPLWAWPIMSLSEFNFVTWCNANGYQDQIAQSSGKLVAEFHNDFLPFAQSKMLKNLVRSGCGMLLNNPPLSCRTSTQMQSVWPIIGGM